MGRRVVKDAAPARIEAQQKHATDGPAEIAPAVRIPLRQQSGSCRDELRIRPAVFGPAPALPQHQAFESIHSALKFLRAGHLGIGPPQ